MDHQTFLKFTQDTFNRCNQIMNAKGPDYSGLEDRLANFKRSAAKYGTTPQQALGITMDKHLQAIETYIRVGKLTGEPLTAKCDDVINYMILLEALETESPLQKNTTT